MNGTSTGRFAGQMNRHHRMVVAVGLALTMAFASIGVPAAAQSRDPFRAAREYMVAEYLEKEGITNERVLASMRLVPRHEFVRSGLRRQAYQDAALAIGYRQTISPPFIVAYMTETIDPQPTDRVLEIGTGSGYQAAVLSGLVEEVYTIEIVEPLGKKAAALLERLGYDNVHTRIGDGYQGWPEAAPFDKIIVTCSPEDVPMPLVEQLKDGGKMIIPLGERYQQVFYLFEKKDGRLVESKLIPTLFVPMTGISEEQRQVQPNPLNPQIVNGGFEADENGDGRVDNWHYQRQAEVVDGGAPEGNRYLRFDNNEPGRLGQVLQGFPIDGREIGGLEIDLQIKVDDIAPGPESYQQPALFVHFYSASRRSLNDEVGVIGPWRRTSDWRPVSATIRVPAQAREAVVRIGLNGATGELCVDHLRLIPRPR